jgi:ribosomal protein S14
MPSPCPGHTRRYPRWSGSCPGAVRDAAMPESWHRSGPPIGRRWSPALHETALHETAGRGNRCSDRGRQRPLRRSHGLGRGRLRQAVISGPLTIRVPRLGTGRPRTRRTRSAPTRRTGPARTAPTCAGAASAARSRRRPAKSATARSVAPAAADRRSSTRPTTRGATRWSAGSIASNATGLWPPDTTNSPSATRQPYWSQPSMSGCDHSHGSLHAHQLIPHVP